MRKRSNYYGFIIMGLLLFLSVGYAVVSSVGLTVTGTAGAATSTLNVAFTGEYTVSNTYKGKATVTSNSTSATFTASNMKLNEEITFKYVVANNEKDINASVSASVNSNSYFEVTLKELSNVGSSINFDLSSNTSTILEVIVKMVKTPITSNDSTANFTVSINASPSSNSAVMTGPIEKKFISFYLISTKYYIEEGTTWSEFINSNDNNDLTEVAGSVLYRSTNEFIVYSGGRVLSDDYIIDGASYYVEECCFDAGMRVLMADGTYKNIEDVEVGDMVMSLNEDTGEYVAQRVKATIINKNSTDLVYVNLSNGVQIGMRAYHPLLTTEGWKSLRPEYAETKIDVGTVELLEVGDTIVGFEENVTVVSVEQRPEVENYYTYNLSVEGYHNYIVEGIVVHNATVCKT